MFVCLYLWHRFSFKLGLRFRFAVWLGFTFDFGLSFRFALWLRFNFGFELDSVLRFEICALILGFDSVLSLG